MLRATVATLTALFYTVRGFRNPLPLILDRFGFQNTLYKTVTRSGLAISVRPKTGDRFTAYETFGARAYGPALELLRPGDIVVDVGANIGCFALAAASVVGHSGRVHAIEPEMNTFERLLLNVEINALTQITPLNVAVWCRTGVVEIIASKDTLFTSSFAIVDGRRIEGEVQKISATTIPDVMNTYTISEMALLKLDCEGAEYEIIAGLTPGICAGIRNIVIEFHDVPGYSVVRAISRLVELGYNHEPGQTQLFRKR